MNGFKRFLHNNKDILLAFTAVCVTFGLLALYQVKRPQPNEKVDQKAYVLLNGIVFLEDSLSLKLDDLAPDCVQVGYTCKLNPEADFYATNEVSGSEVYRSPERCEHLFVKTVDGSYRKYTLVLAGCSLLVNEDSLYIAANDYASHKILYIEVDESRKPAKKKFYPSGRVLRFGEEHIIPRSEEETNDSRLNGAEVLTCKNNDAFVYVDTDGDDKCYMKITGLNLSNEWCKSTAIS